MPMTVQSNVSHHRAANRSQQGRILFVGHLTTQSDPFGDDVAVRIDLLVADVSPSSDRVPSLRAFVAFRR